ncbi:MAG: diguanylate cyclase/phosphodiesterase [Rhodocyclaceae bacterium]|nr:MAG: diguanylate cyclase/phosphodiesterase [Rhodocyclaceae bacterium]TND00604.1 MAG: diguanylate cyclase/phosphodiesterase [Rhodocyclaceae bacterium]
MAAILAENGKAVGSEFSLTPRYRPVADLASGAIFGHLASIHGPPEKLLFAPARLFRMASRLGRTAKFVDLYFRTVVERFVLDHGQGYLLLPLFDGAGDLGEVCIDMLADATRNAALSAERVIVVHAGVGILDGDRLERSLAAARAVRRSGYMLASGCLNCARSEKLLWSALKPEFAMIEDGVLEGFDPNLLRFGQFAQMMAATDARGSRVIAQGVDSPALLKVLREIKVTGASGDFIGKPVTVPTHTLSAAAHKSLVGEAPGYTSQHQGGHRLHVLEKMLQNTPPVTPETLADEVFAMFERTPDLRAVAIVKKDTPIGLIARYDMVDNMARPYRHELYGRKPCTRFMDKEPLTVDIHLPLSEVSEVLVHAHPRHLISGFIITDAGRYLGIGSVQDLVREVALMQMEAAKYANPLTLLPGNVPINQYIDSLLVAGEPCAIAYCDLDHFKPFNDVYGYARGDDVIRLTARILAEVCDSETDFVGHIGGDDFVLVLRGEDWQARCEQALRMFGEEILGFFSHDDIERGGYVTENRKGLMEFHALTSLSIGVTEVKPGAFHSHLDVSVVAAEVKRKAKGIQGNSLYVNRRTY